MITINIDKAKAIAHTARRTARAKEFEPHDAVISKQIPGTSAAEAEAARQAIRARYHLAQVAINAASDASVLADIVHGLHPGLTIPEAPLDVSPAHVEEPVVAPVVVEEPAAVVVVEEPTPAPVVEELAVAPLEAEAKAPAVE